MKYNEALDYILRRIIEKEKRSAGGNFEKLEEEVELGAKSRKENVTEELKTKFQLNGWEINCLFEKLQEDGYISNLENLKISFNGILFITTEGLGGYIAQEQQYKNSLLEQEKIKTLESRLKSTNVKQNWALIIIGTVAAVYYLLEICKFLNS